MPAASSISDGMLRKNGLRMMIEVGSPKATPRVIEQVQVVEEQEERQDRDR
jgi:hypothetical protein